MNDKVSWVEWCWVTSVALVAMVQAVLLVGLWAIDLLCFPPSGSGVNWHAQQRVISPILPTFLLIALATRPWWMQKRRER